MSMIVQRSSSSDVEAIKAVTDVLPDAGALTTLSGNVDDIETVTGALPDAGALSTINAATVAIQAVTDALPDSGALSTINAATVAIQAVTDALPDSGALSTINAATVAIQAVTDVLPDAGVLSSISDETDKIDEAAVDGLAGVSNSLAYKVHEIEKHLHGQGYWYGKDPGDSFLLVYGTTPWQLVAGADDAFGDWVQLSNGDEITAGPRYDPHQVLVMQASAAGKLYYIQFGTGAGGAQAVRTTVAFFPAATLRQGSVPVICPRFYSTDLLWARAACETDAATISFVLGLHTYEG